MTDEISKFVSSSINTAKFNITVYGRILESLENDKYKVMIDGNEYTVRSHWVHNINDVVVIVVCNNNWQNLYVLY